MIEYNDIHLGDEPCEDGVSIHCFRDSSCLHLQELIRDRQPSKYWVLARLIPQEDLTVKQPINIITAEVSLAIYTECTVLWCIMKQATEGFKASTISILPIPH